MTYWPTAATSDVAPGRMPASSSDTPRAVATARIPASAAGQSRRVVVAVGRVGAEVFVAVLTEPSSPFDVTFACRGSRVGGGARLARPGAPVAPLDGDRHLVGAREQLVGEDRLDRAGGDDAPVCEQQGVAEPGRDLLDVM